MARTKVQKKEILDKVAKIVGDSQSLVFVNFHGLKVSGVNEVRRQLKKEGVGYFVAKKSLTRKALESKGIAYKDFLLQPSALERGEALPN